MCDRKAVGLIRKSVHELTTCCGAFHSQHLFSDQCATIPVMMLVLPCRSLPFSRALFDDVGVPSRAPAVAHATHMPSTCQAGKLPDRARRPP